MADPQTKKHKYRPKVFISYAARGTDKDIAKSLRAALEGNKVRVPAWRDKEDLRPGTQAIQDIQKGLADCDYLLLLVSPRSILESRWCRREWRRADHLGKTIIPLILERVEDHQLPLELEELQWIDFQHGVEAGLLEVLKALGVANAHVSVDRDPLDRDDDRIQAFAQIFYYFAGNRHMPPANVKAIMRPLGVCFETTRARSILDAVCQQRFDDCRAAGDWMKDTWSMPAATRRKVR